MEEIKSISLNILERSALSNILSIFKYPLDVTKHANKLRNDCYLDDEEKEKVEYRIETDQSGKRNEIVNKEKAIALTKDIAIVKGLETVILDNLKVVKPGGFSIEEGEVLLPLVEKLENIYK